MTAKTHQQIIKDIEGFQGDSYAGDSLGPALVQIIRAAGDENGSIGLDDILRIAADHLSD